MAKMVEVQAQSRKKIAEEILNVINQVGQDNVISVVMDEGGKFAKNSVFATIKADV